MVIGGQQPLNRKYYYLEFLMHGLSEAVRYEVDHEDGEHLQQLLQQPRVELIPYYAFTAKDSQKVIVSTRDIQMVNILWESAAYKVRQKWRFPRIEIHFQGQAEPYQDFLGDPGWLKVAYDTDTFGLAGEPFLSFINVDDDDIFFNPEQVVLLSYWWDDRINQTTVETIEGAPDFDPEIRGILGAHVWQIDAEYYEEEYEAWYGHVDFVDDDENTAYDYEFDTFGPFATKSEAAAIIQTDFKRLAGMVLKPEGR